jgi:hypothetical protein
VCVDLDDPIDIDPVSLLNLTMQTAPAQWALFVLPLRYDALAASVQSEKTMLRPSIRH